MRHGFSIAFALILSGTASAQQITLLIDNSTSVVVSPRDCNTTRQITWTASTYIGWCQDLRVWVTTGDCGDDSVSGDFIVGSAPFSTATRSFSLPVTSLPIFRQTDGGVACGAAVNQVHRICASAKFRDAFGGCPTSFVRASPPPTIEYRGLAPAAPTITDVLPQDGALTVQTSTSSDILNVHIQIRVAGTADFVEAGTFYASAGKGKVSGLTNGTLYDVRVYGEDAAGNFTDPSDIWQATPVASEGFYKTYRREGGADLGGCGDVGGGGMDWRLALLGLGILPLLRRRRSCRRDR